MHLHYSLLDRGTLVPAGEVAAESSHRPLRIYTLGRFTLVSDGTPLRYSRKAPSKPLLLLKALIAAGGRQVAGSSPDKFTGPASCTGTFSCARGSSPAAVSLAVLPGQVAGAFPGSIDASVSNL